MKQTRENLRSKNTIRNTKTNKKVLQAKIKWEIFILVIDEDPISIINYPIKVLSYITRDLKNVLK